MNMDIFEKIGLATWRLAGLTPPEFLTFVLRWDLMLLTCLLLGYFIKSLFLEGILINTVPSQILAAVISLIVGIALPMEYVKGMSLYQRNIILMAAIAAFAFLPYLVSGYSVRTAGYQGLVCKILYAVSIVLLLVQITILAVR